MTTTNPRTKRTSETPGTPGIDWNARIREINGQPIHGSGKYVLYWMTSARRLGWNFALQRAVDYAVTFKKPLIVFEPLRVDYPHANDRLHRFILDGMAVNRRRAARSRALYFPYVEPSRDHAKGLLETLAADACVVVTDWYPAYFLPRMIRAAGKKLEVKLEAIDSNGIIPLASHGRAFTAARFYRAFVQKSLPAHLLAMPDADPLRRLRSVPAMRALPRTIARRWPMAKPALLQGGVKALAKLPIDHTIQPADITGGSDAARKVLKIFLETRLGRYDVDRNHPDQDATSGLSPYLHFGHLSAHELFAAVMTHEKWTSRRLRPGRAGARDGWWGVSPAADAFLDQLVIWRELAFNACEYVPDHASYDSLPDWARGTIAAHQSDPRPHRYSLARLEAAQTADPIWNAAQRELASTGWFHGYMRMLWGKKIFEWSASGRQALERMQSLMDRYALDGRDPNSYAGYAWVLGRYDRPWPERPVFGTLRYMTSESARRKLRLTRYLERYGDLSEIAPAKRARGKS
jgi:deoxyribodipyrimidine photo-lyase